MPFLTTHFAQDEFEADAPLPSECVQSYKELCLTLLEPIRAKFGPLLVTSGYRPPAINSAVHGVSNSEHVATSEYCAADFRPLSSAASARAIFDWVRSQPGLEWGQVILEHALDAAGVISGPDIIHLSWESTAPRRMALEGATNNREPYKPWAVAPFRAAAPVVTDQEIE